MNQSYSQRHPYIWSILMGLLCTFMTSLGMAVSQMLQLDTDLQLVVITIFLIVSIAIGIFIMKKSRYTVSEYGFQKSKRNSYKKVCWYIPLLIIEIIPILFVGVSSEVTIQLYFILLFFTVAVGFNEEIYFRGLAFKIMEQKGKKKAIIWTSILFGVVHLSNVFNNKEALYLILQMFFALLVGIVLAEIVSLSNSLWVVITWHASHDYIASITGDVLDATALIILAIQVVILLTYAIYMWKSSTREDKKIIYVTDLPTIN